MPKLTGFDCESPGDAKIQTPPSGGVSLFGAAPEQANSLACVGIRRASAMLGAKRGAAVPGSRDVTESPGDAKIQTPPSGGVFIWCGDQSKPTVWLGVGIGRAWPMF